MVIDFEHKAFGEKLIAPNLSDYGVFFLASQRWEFGGHAPVLFRGF